ncbi:MAG: hypothetical protein JRI23_11845 [Deltaproteobacteria bacterium]|jgi:hypothetical protein|nr:hypothetical protein [Deltaproteobacteria bacterium]MBW2532400.1 hypothetical protein [Deltaproteobacteria bacterium]
MRGLSLADRFNEALEDRRVASYQPKLLEPSGESTGGGKQANQSLTLQPAQPDQPALTVGWVNCASNEAKLRTFGCMQMVLAKRFGKRKVVLDAGGYQRFFDAAKEYLLENGIDVEVEEQPPEVASGAHPAVSPSKPASSTTWVIVGLVLIAIGLAMWIAAGR